MCFINLLTIYRNDKKKIIFIRSFFDKKRSREGTFPINLGYNFTVCLWDTFAHMHTSTCIHTVPVSRKLSAPDAQCT